MRMLGSAKGERGWTPSDRATLGRSREAEAIEAFLVARSSLPAAVIVEGEPGIGKTTLWRWAVESARGLGYRVIEASPVQAEAGLVFAGLGDLFGDVFDEIQGRLTTPQRRAMAAALLVDEPGEPAQDQRTLGVAVLSALRILAEGDPVLVAIDDEHWLDQASIAVVGFAVRRLRTESVAILAARRPAPPGGLTRSIVDDRLPSTSIRLGAVSIGALHAILLEHSDRVLPRPHLRRLHDLSQGNPYLALELVRAVDAGRFSLDATAPAAADLDRLLGSRLEPLPEPTRRSLLVVAAASHPTDTLVERAIGAPAAVVLEPAIQAGVVVWADGEVRFSHPLLASTAYGLAGPDARRWVHGILAGLVDDRIERARHAALAAEGPDDQVAAEVELAAMTTFRRGAPAAAADLAALAVRLTDASDLDGIRRRTELQAEYLFEAGDASAAGSLLDLLIDTTSPGRSRAPLLALLARIRHFADDVERGVELGRRALVEADGDDRLLAGIHEGLAWGLFLMRDDLLGAAHHAHASVEAAQRVGDEIALAEGLAAVAITSVAIGQLEPGAMDRAMALEPALVHLRVLRHPSYAKAYVLACTDRLDEAAAVCSDLSARAEEHGDESAVPPIMVQLSLVEMLTGAWDAAEEHARTGHALAIQTGQRPSQVALLGRSALLAAWRGQLDEVDRLAERALASMGLPGDREDALRRAPTAGGEAVVWALGSAALAADRPADAVAYLMPLTDRLLDAGVRAPGEMRFLADTIEALAGVGRLDDADRLATRYATMADAIGGGMQRGIARRCRAIVAGRRGETDEALDSAMLAVDDLGGGQLPLELGRARLVLGELQRRSRQRRNARATLGSALEAFDALGAEGWSARARAELDRIGGRATSDGTLTPTERRVAALVGDGLSNKEVAHALGIASKTVELHLTHVYVKLAVGSRAELVRWLAMGPVEGTPGKP